MPRDKAWWAARSPQQRWIIWNYERNEGKSSGSAYLPDDCSECGVCGQPCLGYGPCIACINEYEGALRGETITPCDNF